MKMNTVTDLKKRAITDLRISLTDRCNFRCTYCMPKKVFNSSYKFLRPTDLLTFEEIHLIAKTLVKMGVKKIRLTGGEPLMRKNIGVLISMLKQLSCNDNSPVEVSLTTNGVILKEKVSDLLSVGLDRITVSLDSIDKAIFQQMSDTKHSPETVLDAIEEARRIGMEVKINTVVKKGVNDSQIIPIASYFKRLGITVRFIEFMDVGSVNSWQMSHVLPSKRIVSILDKEFGVNYCGRNSKNEVSEVWSYKDESSKFGTISSVTKPFCGNCTRLRISSEGMLHTCLFSTKGHDLKPFVKKSSELSGQGNLQTFLSQIWSLRNDQYSMNRLSGIEGSAINEKRIEMSYIGG
ncbi:MAG: GTP 3',8-cyclase MoaA [Betaproteobacteria bacterium TMED82]|nr:MAG: GTP 3',8-cyclase MoaA [Betaproteobacteria bacterium TMED82]